MKIQHKKQVKLTNFRTWKRGKTWLYASSALAILAGGGIIASQINSPLGVTNVYADTSSPVEQPANPTDVSSSAAPNSNIDSLASSIGSVTSSASNDLNSAVSAASSAGVVLSSSSSTVTISLADDSSVASSIASSMASDSASQASSIASIATEQSSINASYAEVSSAISSANTSASSVANQSSNAVSSAASLAESAVSNIASTENISYATSNEVISPSYVTLSSDATASEVASVASENANIYSSAVSDAINSLASEASSASSYLSSAVAATNPSSVGSFTVTTGSLMSQNFVLDANGMDSSAPIVTGGAVVGTGTVSSDGKWIVTDSGSSYGTSWGSSMAGASGYIVSDLTVGDTVTKSWSNIGTLNGNEVSATVTFTVGATQDSNPTMALSYNFITFMTANGFSGNFQISYTWSGDLSQGRI
ncbi:KxYKxGKxW signal peptide domain-containing protein [Lactococcus allomyrinae]|uniref:KxYKxGKxW signal peptide domain-containing protein n=1 Tax=Lactococcus allomyrinae TaxID=2419773 RepID=A0A387B9T3_9LACT|nr:KxYKxGKxW signal peptide domain-containing protein [Lactococcus allomyrinae]AYG00595.1 hypothetical protein D7I46_05500 [Lactococcus allomyrinae]